MSNGDTTCAWCERPVPTKDVACGRLCLEALDRFLTRNRKFTGAEQGQEERVETSDACDDHVLEKAIQTVQNYQGSGFSSGPSRRTRLSYMTSCEATRKSASRCPMSTRTSQLSKRL